ADPREPEVLQHVEELGLQGERQLADLIEVDRALVRIFELSGLAAMGAGEGALLVTEELGFEELLRDRRAVDLDERPLTASRRRMDRSGDEVLADPALATDQHRGVGVGDALDDGADGAHPGMTVEERGLGYRYGLGQFSSHSISPPVWCTAGGNGMQGKC